MTPSGIDPAFVIQDMFKKRLKSCYKDFIAHFTALSPSKQSPLLAIHRSQRFFHCCNASLNALAVTARSSLIEFFWISSMVWKRRRFEVVSSLGNRKKSARAKYVHCLGRMQFILLKMVWIRTLPLYGYRKAGREASALTCTAAETWLQDKLIPHACVEYLSQCEICEDYT
jgi:hypothetical protein